MSQKCTISTLQAIKILLWDEAGLLMLTEIIELYKNLILVYGTWRNSCNEMLFDNGIKWLGSLWIVFLK